MSINASDRTLGLISIWQVLRKLKWEVKLMESVPERIRADEISPDVLNQQDAKLYAAINVASTSVALVDWTYHLAQENTDVRDKLVETFPSLDLRTIKLFRQSFRSVNSSMQICHQICNANKHLYLSDFDQGLNIMVGELLFNNRDGTTDLCAIAQVTHLDGKPYKGGSVFGLLVELCDWWTNLIAELNAPEKSIFYPELAP